MEANKSTNGVEIENLHLEKNMQTKTKVAFDKYCLKWRTLHTVCEFLDTNPQNADTSRQLITYCIDNLQDEQYQANLKKVSIFFYKQD